MKPQILFINLFLFLIINSGCKKNNSGIDSNTAPLVRTLVKEITYKVYTDISGNFLLLGKAYDKEQNIQSFRWEKISGPESFEIENNDSLQTKAHQLIPGVYEFELTVTDIYGLKGKDTTKIIIEKNEDIQIINSNELIINNLQWISDWNSKLEIKDFIYSFSPGSGFEVYLQRTTNGDWIPIPEYKEGDFDEYNYYIDTTIPNGSGMYSYGIYGSLFIFYEDNIRNEKPLIKIKY